MITCMIKWGDVRGSGGSGDVCEGHGVRGHKKVRVQGCESVPCGRLMQCQATAVEAATRSRLRAATPRRPSCLPNPLCRNPVCRGPSCGTSGPHPH